jgi:hypothetical protein
MKNERKEDEARPNIVRYEEVFDGIFGQIFTDKALEELLQPLRARHTNYGRTDHPGKWQRLLEQRVLTALRVPVPEEDHHRQT